MGRRRRGIDAAFDVLVARDVIFIIVVFLLAFSLPPDLSQLFRQSADAADAAGRECESRQRDASSPSSVLHRRGFEQSGAFEAFALRRHLREAEHESVYEIVFIYCRLLLLFLFRLLIWSSLLLFLFTCLSVEA